jgi:hypothetical protein
VKCWINTVSYEHVKAGIEGGFTQADHGLAKGLRRLSQGDFIVFYSPRTKFRSGEPLQQFTAIARVGEGLYQVEMTPTFKPWRQRVEFLKCKPASARALIEELSFIKDKGRWGFVFRRGLFEIPTDDFLRIAEAMDAQLQLLQEKESSKEFGSG